MITAHTDKNYLLDAVELHMEKYIIKPIDLDELFEVLEKCVTLLEINATEILKVDKDYIYDYDNKELNYQSKRIILNKKEMSFFELLVSNQNRIVTYEELQEYVWGDDDWYYQNPWTVFFIYESQSPWSTLPDDKIMNGYIKKFFKTKIDTREYEDIVSKILYRARDMAYTLRVPSPNKVIAVNKEVIYKPYQGGMIPLWNIQITKNHWSIREDEKYPQFLQNPIKPKRVKSEINK